MINAAFLVLTNWIVDDSIEGDKKHVGIVRCNRKYIIIDSYILRCTHSNKELNGATGNQLNIIDTYMLHCSSLYPIRNKYTFAVGIVTSMVHY